MSVGAPGGFEAGSPGALRARNERAILESLLHDPGAGLTRAELARRTGLSSAGVANVLAGSLSEVVSSTSGPPLGRPGPPPELLTIDPSLGYLLAIDLGPSYVAGFVADFHGRPFSDEPYVREISADADPVRSVETAVAMARELVPGSSAWSRGWAAHAS